MRKIGLSLMVAGLTACASEPQAEAPKKYMLILGDSISIGYAPTIEKLMPGYEVTHNPGNAMSSRNGVANIDTWLAGRPMWDVITFNHGFWDLSPDDGTGRYLTTEYEYRDNLTIIAHKVKAKALHPIFILISNKPTSGTDFTDAQVQARNTIAKSVMALENIPVLDLYSFTWQTEVNAQHASPIDIHFTPLGYQMIGQYIAGSICNMF